jgi:1,4-dihydroxy-2-naphthoate octaprenyltransferase
MNNLKFLLGPMRLPFLTLPPVCVLLGVGTASWTQGKINIWYALIAFVGALAAHISVNALNEYFDFRSGLDHRTRPTPFSGGSGTLPAHPEAARVALITGLVTLAVAAVVGIYFVTVWGWELLPLGILGLALLVIYTPWITRFPFLCLIAPGLGFGTFMVMGTDFVLTGHYSWTAFFASLVPFFLVSNLLLLNQFPDAEADRTVGRRHYPITIGRKKSSIIYGAFVAGAYLAIIVGWLIGVLPAASLLGLLTLYIGVRCVIGAYKYADQMDKLIPYLAQNVILNITMPLLAAIGLLIA